MYAGNMPNVFLYVLNERIIYFDTAVQRQKEVHVNAYFSASSYSLN